MTRKRKAILSASAALVVVILAVFIKYVWLPTFGRPPLERVDEYVWLDQGWGTGQNAELRQRYYYTAQGTSIPQGASDSALRYDWFLKLERPLSQERFAAPENMRRYRFVVDPEASPANPDHLPVGFTRHFDPHIGEYVLDVTCAACHTGEIHYTKDGRTRAMRIDGGPANGRHRAGAVAIPVNEWTTIQFEVLKDRMRVRVNGTIVQVWRANFGKMTFPLTIFPAEGSTVKVKSIGIFPGDPRATTEP